MAYVIHAKKDSPLIKVVTNGSLSVEEFYAMILETGEVCRASGIKQVLVDHSKAFVGHLSRDSIQAIADFCVQVNDPMVGCRLAILLSRDLDFGVSRIWLALVDGRLTYACELFRERKTALEWLGCSSATGVEGIAKAVSERVQ